MAISKAKQLSKKYGGNWEYDGMASWWCDDKLRHVSRTCSCSHDDYCDCPPNYWLYSKKAKPILITWGKNFNFLK